MNKTVGYSIIIILAVVAIVLGFLFISTNGKLSSTQIQLVSVQSDLLNTKNQLTNTQNQLASVQSDLSNTKNLLASVQAQLANAQGQTSALQSRLANPQPQILSSNAQFQSTGFLGLGSTKNMVVTATIINNGGAGMVTVTATATGPQGNSSQSEQVYLSQGQQLQIPPITIRGLTGSETYTVSVR